MSTTVRSFCKINLGLAVGPKRPDGFHSLATCYQTLALHDLVTVTARPATRTTVQIQTDHAGVPSTASGDAERNTAWKMVTSALDRLGISADVAVLLEKRLPVQGGLGAGSANAAAALLGLERELGRSLAASDRLDLAADVGSDVPLFLLGGTVLGLGRGEQVYPLPDLPELPCVVATPSVGVSTAQAFRALDARGLTGDATLGRIEKLSRALSAAWTFGGADIRQDAGNSVNAFEPSFTGIATLSEADVDSANPLSGGAPDRGQGAGDLAESSLLALVRTGMENDFEEVVFSEHPLLRSTKRDLMGGGPGEAGSALFAALSGSGSALFGLYAAQADADAAQRRVEASGLRAFVTKTIARPGYWQSVFAGARTKFAEEFGSGSNAAGSDWAID